MKGGRPSAAAILALASAVVPCIACSQASVTEILLVVDSDLPRPERIDEVHLVIATETSSSEVSYHVGVPGAPLGEQFPISLGLVPDKKKDLLFRVVAEGRKAGTVVIKQSAASAFVPGEKHVLTLRLDAPCAGVSCAPGATCRAQAGRDACVPEDVYALDLPLYTDGGLPTPGSSDAAAPTDGKSDAKPDAKPGG